MAENTTQLEQVNKALLEKEGKYLTFALGREEYGLEILKVREIIGYMEITAVPQTPHYVKGVINLRGQVIPVIDLRARSIERDSSHCANANRNTTIAASDASPMAIAPITAIAIRKFMPSVRLRASFQPFLAMGNPPLRIAVTNKGMVITSGNPR